MRMLLLILTLSGVLSAQQPSPSDVLASIRQRYQALRDASAGFSQTVKRRYAPVSKPTAGTVKIKRGNKYRIETDQQVIVTDGNTVWMYTPKTGQVLVDTYSAKRQTFSPDQFLLGLPKEVTPVSALQTDSIITLTLKPSGTAGALKSVATIAVRTVAGRWGIDAVELTDKNGTVTTIVLTGMRMNAGIDDAAFRFTVTDSMHVVDVKTLR
jgi:chaperone LolA